jgi:hypothetical protein
MAADTREARLDALLDRADIYDCLLRMSRGSDRFDRELFLSSCHADAVLAAGPFVGSPEELYDWSSQLQRSTYRATMHQLSNFTCDIDCDTAHTETYYLFTGCIGEETNLLAGGRYVDRFERRGGQWGIVLRNNFIEWTSAVPAMVNPLGAIPDLHLNGLPAHDRTDPSYARPLRNQRARRIP